MNDIDLLKEDFQDCTIFQNNFHWEIDAPEGFNEWFIMNGEYLESTIKKTPKKIKIRQTTGQQCFHNSQLLSIDNERIEYYEGIMYGPKFKTVRHHGFNKIENKTIDLTFIYNTEKFINKDIRDKYYIYFGVKIPKVFIQNYAEILKKTNQHNPILIDYYKYRKAIEIKK